MNQRSPITALIFSMLIPFYILYWLYQMSQVFRARGANPPSLKLLVVPVLIYFVAIFGLMIPVLATSAGSTVRTTLGALSLFIVFGVVIAMIVCSILYYYRFSEAAETVTSGKVSKILSFVLFMVFAPATAFIIQEAVNQLPEDTKNNSSASSPLAS